MALAGMDTVYLETTIVSFLVARPSRDLIVAAHQQLTREWWERRRAMFSCFISQVVIEEAAVGDAGQAARRLDELRDLPQLVASAQAEALAAAFLQRCLPPKAARDAAHLAIATAGHVKYLLTWNCNHLANAQILDQLEPVAVAAGLRLPRVCTPEELMGIGSYE